MFNKALIIFGVTIILLLVGVWIYLFLYGTPKDLGEAFSNFRLESPTEERPEVPIEATNTQIPLTAGTMVQLSTKPAAGFIYLEEGSRLRYAERGTGYVFEIDLSTGQEERIQGVTRGKTIAAHFSPEGNAVVLVSEGVGRTEAVLQILGGPGDGVYNLPNNIENVHFLDLDTIRWTVADQTGTRGYEFNRPDQSTRQLWQVPLRDVRVFWQNGSTYVINKPAPRLRGGVYAITNGQLSSLVPAKYALSAVIDPGGELMLLTYFDTETRAMRSEFLNLNTNETTETTLKAVPEKCAVDNFSRVIWCALSSNFFELDRDTLNRWYRGEFTAEDELWTTSLVTENLGISQFVADNTDQVIDMTDVTVTSGAEFIFFRNKVNDSLWMYKKSE